MAYRFRLETLLTYRRNLEEQAQLKLASDLQVLLGQQGRLADLQVSRQLLGEEFEEQKQKRLSGPFFSFYMDAIRHKEEAIEAQQAAIAVQQQVVEKSRLELAERVKSRKIIEKAREKDYRKFQHETLRKEQIESDEQAILRAGRKDLLL
ncbi:MAG: flagellar export protein FliJ [Desulfobulbaceae bacterium]|nr:flagellar export protein FliJ [Desulfobulbaceae bacterium]